MEPCGTSLVTGHQSDVNPLTITLCAHLVSQLLTHFMMCLLSSVLDTLLGTVKDSSESLVLARIGLIFAIAMSENH